METPREREIPDDRVLPAERLCPLCKAPSTHEHKAVPGAWVCRACGYVWRARRGVKIEPQGRSVDQVDFYNHERRVGFRLADNDITTRNWTRYWLEELVDNPGDLTWDGVRVRRN